MRAGEAVVRKLTQQLRESEQRKFSTNGSQRKDMESMPREEGAALAHCAFSQAITFCLRTLPQGQLFATAEE